MKLKLKLKSNTVFDNRMDEECVEICDVLNAIPNIKTVESYYGHDDKYFRIYINTENNNSDGIFFLARSIDDRYFKYGKLCNLKVYITNINNNVNYILEIKTTDVSLKKSIVDSIIKNLNYHLNNENFMNDFNLDINAFKTELF